MDAIGPDFFGGPIAIIGVFGQEDPDDRSYRGNVLPGKTMKDLSVFRHLPDRRDCAMFPYHISLEGLERLVLCRVESDYDAFVIVIEVSVRRKIGIAAKTNIPQLAKCSGLSREKLRQMRI